MCVCERRRKGGGRVYLWEEKNEQTRSADGIGIYSFYKRDSILSPLVIQERSPFAIGEEVVGDGFGRDDFDSE